jgi:hypothetical protein
MCVAMVCGCATWNSVQTNGAAPPYGIKAGQWCSVKTTDGQTHKFKVTEITESSLIGEDIEVGFTDIASIEVKKRGTAKGWAIGTAGMIGIVAVATFFVLGQSFTGR